MPGRNRNARVVYRPDKAWKGYRPTGFHLDEANSPLAGSQLKTTGESIVRDYRNSLAKPETTFQSYRVRPQAVPSAIRSFIRRINWSILIDYMCIGLAVLAIAMITGIIFFGPSSLEEIFR